MKSRRKIIAFAISSMFFGINLAHAAGIDWYNPFALDQVISSNSVGLPAGRTLAFGVGCAVPTGITCMTDGASVGISGQATQMNSVTGITRSVPLNYLPSDVAPNYHVNSVAYLPGLTGAWDISLSGPGGTTAAFTTPSVGLLAALPFPKNVSISGNLYTPTFNWTLPGTFTPSTVQVNVWDLQSGPQGNTTVVNLLGVATLSSSATNYTVPTSFSGGQTLQLGHRYSIEIALTESRGGVVSGPPGSFPGYNTIDARSRAFFDFVPVSLAAGVGSVVLPTVTPGAPGAGPVYSFHVDVSAGTPVFIDPLVAVGYDYQIGAGNPKFASVTLPTGIGDNKYELWLWDGSKFVGSNELTGGVTFGFGSDGIDLFRITGIEASANLDPGDTTAFITGLTFASSGEFTGSMTPITVNVPEPESYAMLLAGLGLLGFVARRRKQGAA